MWSGLPSPRLPTCPPGFLAQVNNGFDRAAAFTRHQPTLLDQIKSCNAVYYVTFPLRPG
jgi:hypothetical protein